MFIETIMFLMMQILKKKEKSTTRSKDVSFGENQLKKMHAEKILRLKSQCLNQDLTVERRDRRNHTTNDSG
jgi:hypothetical protein